MKKLDRSEKALIGSSGLHAIISLFSDTFLVAYFLQVSMSNLKNIAVYHFVLYFVLMIVIFLMGRVALRYNRGSIYRLGILLNSLFVLVIAVLKSGIQDHFLLLAVLYGISQAVYSAAYMPLMNEITNLKTRKRFLTTKTFIDKSIRVIVPFLLGASIATSSFYQVAVYIFFVTIIQIVFSLFIKVPDSKKRKFDMAGFFRKVDSTKGARKQLSYVVKIMAVFGCCFNIMATMIVVLIMMKFHNSFNLGTLTTVFAGVSLVSIVFFQQLYRGSRKRWLIFTFALLPVLGVVNLFFGISQETIIVYYLINSIVAPCLSVVCGLVRSDYVERYQMEDYLVEYQSFLEIPIGLSRLLGYGLLFLVAVQFNEFIFQMLLLLVTLCFPFLGYYAYKASHIIRKEKRILVPLEVAVEE